MRTFLKRSCYGTIQIIVSFGGRFGSIGWHDDRQHAGLRFWASGAGPACGSRNVLRRINIRDMQNVSAYAKIGPKQSLYTKPVPLWHRDRDWPDVSAHKRWGK